MDDRTDRSAAFSCGFGLNPAAARKLLETAAMLARVAFAVSALSFAIAGCADDPAAPAPEVKPADVPQQGATPPAPEVSLPVPVKAGTLTTVACRYIVPASIEGKTFHCADLVVPENRRNAGSAKTITLHVAVLHGKPGGVPTVELIGGPGAGGEDLVGVLVAGRKDVADSYAPLLAKGDLVVFDQRGIGRSIPRLNCDLFVSGNPIRKCKAKLEADGVDVTAYDTAENADDVHDLRVALGVPKVDLHGISYGTRLALEIMKRHPDDVRASIIDGVMPPDVPVIGGFSVAVDSVVTRIFAACKADAKCNAAYPDLEATLVALKSKLDATPFAAKDAEGDYPYDWFAFTSELTQRLYSEGTGALVPRWITRLEHQTQAEFDATLATELAAEDATWAAQEAEDAKNPLIAELYARQAALGDEDPDAFAQALGMYLSVTCNDYGQHETVAAARAAYEKIRPVLRDDYEIEQGFDDCKHWATRPSEPITRAASTFAGPTLVIGGDFDPATPVEWARRVETTLPHDQLVVVPDGGHGLMDACGAGLKGAFLGDPTRPLDATCASARTVRFAYDEAGTEALHHREPPLAFVPKRPAATHLEHIANLATLASKPAALQKRRYGSTQPVASALHIWR